MTGAEISAISQLGDKASVVGPSIGKGIMGAMQARAGKRLRDEYDRPIYERPQEARQALSTAEMMAYTDMPGLARTEELAAGRTANVADQIQQTGQDTASKIKGLTGLYQGELDTLRDLAVSEAGFRLDSLRNYQNELGRAAAYSDQEFQINRMEPYENAMLAASELTGAGLSNMYAGMSDLSSGMIGTGDTGDTSNMDWADTFATPDTGKGYTEKDPIYNDNDWRG